MKTLILKRKWDGYYTNQVGDITIVVSQSDLSKQWSGSVTNQKEIEDDKYLLYVCYGRTKKEVVSQMVSYFTNPK
jgi:hypothetical protein